MPPRRQRALGHPPLLLAAKILSQPDLLGNAVFAKDRYELPPFSADRLLPWRLLDEASDLLLVITGACPHVDRAKRDLGMRPSVLEEEEIHDDDLMRIVVTRSVFLKLVYIVNK